MPPASGRGGQRDKGSDPDTATSAKANSLVLLQAMDSGTGRQREGAESEDGSDANPSEGSEAGHGSVKKKSSRERTEPLHFKFSAITKTHGHHGHQRSTKDPFAYTWDDEERPSSASKPSAAKVSSAAASRRHTHTYSCEYCGAYKHYWKPLFIKHQLACAVRHKLLAAGSTDKKLSVPIKAPKPEANMVAKQISKPMAKPMAKPANPPPVVTPTISSSADADALLSNYAPVKQPYSNLRASCRHCGREFGHMQPKVISCNLGKHEKCCPHRPNRPDGLAAARKIKGPASAISKAASKAMSGKVPAAKMVQAKNAVMPVDKLVCAKMSPPKMVSPKVISTKALSTKPANLIVPKVISTKLLSTKTSPTKITSPKVISTRDIAAKAFPQAAEDTTDVDVQVGELWGCTDPDVLDAKMKLVEKRRKLAELELERARAEYEEACLQRDLILEQEH